MVLMFMGVVLVAAGGLVGLCALAIWIAMVTNDE